MFTFKYIFTKSCVDRCLIRDSTVRIKLVSYSSYHSETPTLSERKTPNASHGINIALRNNHIVNSIFETSGLFNRAIEPNLFNYL